MAEHPGDTMRSLLAEFATGAIAGDERAQVLEHLAFCGSCRQELTRLTRAVDTLLAFAPRMEPPPGFESRVLAALDTGPPAAQQAGPARRWGGVWRRAGRSRLGGHRGPWGRRDGRRFRATRALTAVVIAATALFAGVAVTHWRDQDERRLADSYRRTLSVANGTFLTASALTTAEGRRAGTVFLYQGNPSWLVVTVTGALADGRYQMLVVDREGDHHPAGWCMIRNRTGTTGYDLPLPAGNVAEVRLRLAGQDDVDLSSGYFSGY
jgi:putative zinc finger protein